MKYSASVSLLRCESPSEAVGTQKMPLALENGHQGRTRCRGPIERLDMGPRVTEGVPGSIEGPESVTRASEPELTLPAILECSWAVEMVQVVWDGIGESRDD
jgi:hypothetical protein